MFVANLLLLLLGAQVQQASPTYNHLQHIMASSSFSSSSDEANKVREQLQKAEIIPTVIDDFVPSFLLSVSWPDAKQEASLGNTLKPDDLQDVPVVSVKSVFGGQKSGENIVIVATDPDAPSRDDPKWSEFCHWIGVSTGSGSGSERGRLELDETVVEYKPPGPPKGTGKHRYVFLALVAVNGTTQRLELSKPKERKHWGYGGDGNNEVEGVRRWAGENGLVVVAANFIYAQNKKQ
ncbi:phosphatidylethanolamine-binding protein [Cladorrhinum sp. PSN332]|nr:phosphatidylethanolamine-binding protein [Cladorrhinum sp. PSN332]